MVWKLCFKEGESINDNTWCTVGVEWMYEAMREDIPVREWCYVQVNGCWVGLLGARPKEREERWVGAGCEAQVKNNQQASSRTRKQGCLHSTGLDVLFWPTGLHLLVPVLEMGLTGARISVGAANCGLRESFFFEMNISLTFYHDLSWAHLVQPHFLRPKIAFSCWSSLRPDCLERTLTKSLPP